MGMWLNKVKSDMYQFNNRQSTNIYKYTYVSQYILGELIPESVITNYGCSESRLRHFVFVSTNTRVFKIRRDHMYAYTDNANDCIELAINKHYSEFLNLEEVTGMEYVREED